MFQNGRRKIIKNKWNLCCNGHWEEGRSRDGSGRAGGVAQMTRCDGVDWKKTCLKIEGKYLKTLMLQDYI